jgi:phosphate uptake regulator
MFEWFSKQSDAGTGLDKMRAEFGQMLDAGRHTFDAAANAFLGGTDLEVIRQDLFDTDKRINEAEQRIRKEIVVHATVHGVSSFPACLVLMTVVKDAERVGDYAKNIFDLAALTSELPAGEFKDDLIKQKDHISQVMAHAREIYDKQDRAAAQDVIDQAQKIEDHCDAQIASIIRDGTKTEPTVSYALAYRYFKRVASHTLNVVTSIVQPVHKIDYAE